MAVVPEERDDISFGFVSREVTGAIGDSVTVLPIVVAVAALTDLSLAVMLIWFGIFQLVWGLYYGLPLSVEPMKAVAALLLAGVITTGEFLVAGVLAGGVLLLLGTTHTLDRLDPHIGMPVIRGIQLAVALLLLQTGVELGLSNPLVAGGATVVALTVVAAGYRNLSALVVLVAGGLLVSLQTGLPAMSQPAIEFGASLSSSAVTMRSVEATVAQLAMTIGNAAVATSVLLHDFFDREVSPDELSTSMGVMNLVAIPAGGLPMCHGSGGVAGKYAFGARTAVANVVLGIVYVGIALAAVGLVAAFPLSMLGVVLVMVAIQLGYAGLQTTQRGFVIGVGLLGAFVNVGVAFVVGTGLYLLLTRREGLQ